jgi:hypothetical protein
MPAPGLKHAEASFAGVTDVPAASDVIPAVFKPKSGLQAEIRKTLTRRNISSAMSMDIVRGIALDGLRNRAACRLISLFREVPNP